MQQLDNIVARLEQQAQQFDAENRKRQRKLREQWFSQSLFHSRSNLAVDYVQELKQLIAKLSDANRPEVRNFLAEQVSQQLMALPTALNGSSLPVEKKDKRLVQQSRLAQMHQQLATYRGYEQRLLINIENCRRQHDSIGAQQQEKRLNRCQQALATLEASIQQLEEGR